jgi:hypothetical protein
MGNQCEGYCAYEEPSQLNLPTNENNEFKFKPQRNHRPKKTILESKKLGQSTSNSP